LSEKAVAAGAIERQLKILSDIAAGSADLSAVDRRAAKAVSERQPVVSVTPAETDTANTYFEAALGAATLAATSADFSPVNAQSAAINASRVVALIACGLDAVFDQAVPCQARDAAVAAMRWDFELLREAARREGWTNEKRVSQEFFGDLWPYGKTKLSPLPERPWTILYGPPGTGKTTIAKELVRFYSEGFENKDELNFSVEVPDGASDTEVVEFVKRLAAQADALHRSYGGNGLKVESLEVFGEAPVPEGVR